ncbi:hypothetical protein [Novipirellula artificiosorum]|uniref:Uncharacterized protein n=1 Tax=Novipirellula artificiosorum TaxID=2528016 RepID=A0A5C6D7N1_9BACT|nr:hypothetical protein [Novipirellula artificiosorum]TWU31711.1 hypothetical protein Poly41_59450 [Novipirellula artificiosorum]
MSIYRQNCPSCGRQLELPGDAMGKVAKCPACEATFRIGETAALPPSTPTPPSPPSVAANNPFSQPISADPASAGPAAAASSAAANQPGVTNPYHPATEMPPPVAKIGELEIVQRPIEDIFSPTMSIFGARWAPLILSSLIVFLAMGLLTGIPFIVLMVIADGGNDFTAAILMLFFMPIAIFLGAYVTVGLARVALAVARNESEPLSQLIPPLNLVFRFLGGGLLMVLAVAVVVAAFAAIAALLAAITQNETVAVGVVGIGMLILFLVSMAAQWLLWPWVFVVSDGKASAIGSIRAAFQIVMNNKVTSLLIVVISVGLSMLGNLLCYVGLIVTQPLTLLMFAVGYLVLTNQPISNPKAIPTSYPTPPSTPTF